LLVDIGSRDEEKGAIIGGHKRKPRSNTASTPKNTPTDLNEESSNLVLIKTLNEEIDRLKKEKEEQRLEKEKLKGEKETLLGNGVQMLNIFQLEELLHRQQKAVKRVKKAIVNVSQLFQCN
jgi:hypothetical protein